MTRVDAAGRVVKKGAAMGRGPAPTQPPSPSRPPRTADELVEFHNRRAEALTMPAIADHNHKPCRSVATAYLSVVSPHGADLYCGLLEGHDLPHVFHMEWWGAV